jgi:hypothetical protein
MLLARSKYIVYISSRKTSLSTKPFPTFAFTHFTVMAQEYSRLSAASASSSEDEPYLRREARRDNPEPRARSRSPELGRAPREVSQDPSLPAVPPEDSTGGFGCAATSGLFERPVNADSSGLFSLAQGFGEEGDGSDGAQDVAESSVSSVKTPSPQRRVTAPRNTTSRQAREDPYTDPFAFTRATWDPEMGETALRRDIARFFPRRSAARLQQQARNTTTRLDAMADAGALPEGMAFRYSLFRHRALNHQQSFQPNPGLFESAPENGERSLVSGPGDCDAGFDASVNPLDRAHGPQQPLSHGPPLPESPALPYQPFVRSSLSDSLAQAPTSAITVGDDEPVSRAMSSEVPFALLTLAQTNHVDDLASISSPFSRESGVHRSLSEHGGQSSVAVPTLLSNVQFNVLPLSADTLADLSQLQSPSPEPITRSLAPATLGRSNTRYADLSNPSALPDMSVEERHALGVWFDGLDEGLVMLPMPVELMAMQILTFVTQEQTRAHSSSTTAAMPPLPPVPTSTPVSALVPSTATAPTTTPSLAATIPRSQPLTNTLHFRPNVPRPSRPDAACQTPARHASGNSVPRLDADSSGQQPPSEEGL